MKTSLPLRMPSNKRKDQKKLRVSMLSRIKRPKSGRTEIELFSWLLEVLTIDRGISWKTSKDFFLMQRKKQR